MARAYLLRTLCVKCLSYTFTGWYTGTMKCLLHDEQKEAQTYLEHAANIAQKATCSRASCGCVIVKEGTIIGKGFNSPPLELETQRRCMVEKSSYAAKVTDKTCCVHAEQRAIMHALRTHSNELQGSRLYFIRLDKNKNITKSGKPYCTICSKMALDVGIAEFVLWHEDGICVYDTQEYNKLSFDFTLSE